MESTSPIAGSIFGYWRHIGSFNKEERFWNFKGGHQTAIFIILDKRYTLVYHAGIKRIEYYTHTNGKIPVKIWMKTLDVAMNKRIFGRLARIEEDDNFGDYKKLNEDISELRFNFGSGYRIYYAEVGEIVVLLLNAGDKKFQSKDIAKAKEYLEIWRQNNG